MFLLTKWIEWWQVLEQPNCCWNGYVQQVRRRLPSKFCWMFFLFTWFSLNQLDRFIDQWYHAAVIRLDWLGIRDPRSKESRYTTNIFPIHNFRSFSAARSTCQLHNLRQCHTSSRMALPSRDLQHHRSEWDSSMIIGHRILGMDFGPIWAVRRHFRLRPA